MTSFIRHSNIQHNNNNTTLSLNYLQKYVFIAILTAITINVVMLNVVILSVTMLNVIMISVWRPFFSYEVRNQGKSELKGKTQWYF